MLEALGRLFGFGPFFVLSLIAIIVAATVWIGWSLHIGMWQRTTVELIVFAGEIIMLLYSYLYTVLKGPGFVPKGWEPSPKDLQKAMPEKALRPLSVAMPIADCLQHCKLCGTYKAPRTHHCSICQRCVLWMDHHCPWTNTCIGHHNLRAFVLFTHYVCLACLHSTLVHAEVMIKNILLWWRSETLWAFVQQLQAEAILSMLVMTASSIVLILVGSLAWELEWTVAHNVTLVEDNIICRAQKLYSKDESAVEYPYDLGWRRNLQQIMGPSFWAWLTPAETPADDVWPEVQIPGIDLALPMEQLAQKADTVNRAMMVEVERAFNGARCCACCFGYCSVLCQHGSDVASEYPCCYEDPCLNVQPGDQLAVINSSPYWLQTSMVRGGSHRVRGWIPRGCVRPGSWRRNEVPSQSSLQGFWENEAGSMCEIRGCLVFVSGGPAPYVLRAWPEGASTVGSSTLLLGCKLRSCSETEAVWELGCSTGLSEPEVEVWTRLQMPDILCEDDDEDAAGSSGESEQQDHVRKRR